MVFIISTPLTLSMGVPQGCVLSPLPYSISTHHCVSTHYLNLVVKFTDDTTVVDFRNTAWHGGVRRTTSSVIVTTTLGINHSSFIQQILRFGCKSREVFRTSMEARGGCDGPLVLYIIFPPFYIIRVG